MDVVEKVYLATNKLPSSEQFGLMAQMRRAAVSIPSNIAEGYGRQAKGEYRHHLSISRGSALELETQVLVGKRLRYLHEPVTSSLEKDIAEISRMLATLVSKLL
jgi:four helix bundle protein